jgi:hypothetical protein
VAKSRFPAQTRASPRRSAPCSSASPLAAQGPPPAGRR